MRPGVRPLQALVRSELPIDTVTLARYLIGKILIRDTAHGALSGRIVETEAYPVGDAAGHAYYGMTLRNRSLFLCRGHAYVYQAYGTSYLLNVASEPAGVGAGVLIRALEPMDGIAAMLRHRGIRDVHDLARGPGRLAAALQIDRRLDGIDLCGASPLRLAADGLAAREVATSKRLGVTRAAASQLRFYSRGNRFVSGPHSLNQ